MGATLIAMAQAAAPQSQRIIHESWTFKHGAPEGVSALAQTADGFLWLGAPAGLFRFDGVRFEPFRSHLAISSSRHMFSRYSRLRRGPPGSTTATLQMDSCSVGHFLPASSTGINRPDEEALRETTATLQMDSCSVGHFLPASSTGINRPDEEALLVRSRTCDPGDQLEHKSRTATGIIEFLSKASADLILLQEADVNARRTQHRNIAREIAQALRMNYVFGREFQELTQGNHSSPAYHGQATLSRFPILSSRILTFGRQSGFWRPRWFIPQLEKSERRLGDRMALVSQVGWLEKRLAGVQPSLGQPRARIGGWEYGGPLRYDRPELHDSVVASDHYPLSVAVQIS